MSFLFKRKDFEFWYIGYYDESGKMKKISTSEKLKTRADVIHDVFKKKSIRNIVPDILYFKDVQGIVFNFIKNNFVPGTLFYTRVQSETLTPFSVTSRSSQSRLLT